TMGSAKTPITERFMWIFNTFFHQALAVVTVFIFWTIFYNQKLNSQFSWHLILSTLAYVPLMGEAIVLFASDNVWSGNIDRAKKCWIHGIILIISAVLVTVGISLMIDLSSGSHFQSIHGWTGLVSWIFVLLSQFLGLVAAHSRVFSSLLRPVYLKFSHNLFGTLGYIFGIVSLCYGLDTRAFTNNTSHESRVAVICLLAVTTTWSILAALRSGYDQLKTIFF
ncbi:cytochrome b561 domain-containing protein 2, partial [Asbolus verrucosus]